VIITELPTVACYREVLRYYEACPAPFDYLSATQAGDLPYGLQPSNLVYVTLYGLHACPRLQQLWKWPQMAGLLQSSDINVRWTAIHCLGACLTLPQSSIQQLVQQALSLEDALACTLRWQNYCASLATERAAMLCTPSGSATCAVAKSDGELHTSPSRRKRKHADISDATAGAAAGYVRICGVDLPVRQTPPGLPSSADGTVVVATSTFNDCMVALALGLCTSAPILIEGPPGSGKSTMISHVADLTGNSHGKQGFRMPAGCLSLVGQIR
jgi:hypothetical protein